MKGKGKRILSGLLSLLTILTSVVQPVVTYAAEPEPAGYEAQYPALETVREYLDAEEVVTAEDYEVETGSSFDVESDFSGLEIHDEKVRVTFHEAKNEAGQDFDGNHADTYKAVYFVEPFKRPSVLPYLQKHYCKRAGGGETGGEPCRRQWNRRGTRAKNRIVRTGTQIHSRRQRQQRRQ